MNIETIYYFSQIVSVLAIFCSLLFVGQQLRQNTKTVRAATELETGRQWSEFHSRMAHSQDMADIWDKGLTKALDLNPSEKRKFIWLVAEYFFLVENLYRQREMNLVSGQTWIQHSKAAAGLLNHPLLTSWWNSGVSPYSIEFIAAIDIASRELGEAVWSYTPLSEL